MKTCPKCNAQLPDDAAFCNECGASVSAVKPNTAAPANNANNANPAPANTSAGNSSDAKASDSAPAAANNASNATANNAAANNAATANAAPNNAADTNTAANNAANANGAPTGTEPVDIPFQPFAKDGDVAKALNKLGPQKIGIIAAAAVAVIAILIILISSLGAYKKPINTLVSLANKKSTNIPAYVDCVAPSFVSSSYKSLLGTLKGGDAKKELEETIKDAFDDAWDELEDEYGKNWKISVEWKDADRLSNKKLDAIKDRWEDIADTLGKAELDDEDTYESIADSLDDKYDTELNTKQVAQIMGKLADQFENAKITDGYEVDLKLTIEGKDGHDTTKMDGIYVIKVNGQWIIDPTSGAAGYDISDLTRLMRYM